MCKRRERIYDLVDVHLNKALLKAAIVSSVHHILSSATHPAFLSIEDHKQASGRADNVSESKVSPGEFAHNSSKWSSEATDKSRNAIGTVHASSQRSEM